MKKLNIICFGIIMGFLVGSFLPKEIIHVPEEPKQPVVEIYEEVYKVEVVTVQEAKPEELIITPGNGSGFTLLDVPLEEEVQEYVYEQCVQYNIDYYLVMALISHESEFIPDVVSSTGDYGLMQINKCNHKEGIDYLDPYQNISEGMMLLDYLFNKYNDAALVLMAYNMGESGASNLWEQGIYTTDYVKEIFTEQELLQESIMEGR